MEAIKDIDQHMLCTADPYRGIIEHTNRKNRILTVQNIWLEPGVRQTKKLADKIGSAVQRLAGFNGCVTGNATGETI